MNTTSPAKGSNHWSILLAPQNNPSPTIQTFYDLLVIPRSTPSIISIHFSEWHMQFHQSPTGPCVLSVLILLVVLVLSAAWDTCAPFSGCPLGVGMEGSHLWCSCKFEITCGSTVEATGRRCRRYQVWEHSVVQAMQGQSGLACGPSRVNDLAFHGSWNARSLTVDGPHATRLSIFSAGGQSFKNQKPGQHLQSAIERIRSKLNSKQTGIVTSATCIVHFLLCKFDSSILDVCCSWASLSLSSHSRKFHPHAFWIGPFLQGRLVALDLAKS